MDGIPRQVTAPTDGEASGADDASAPALLPLAVSGLVVTKAALLAVLARYVPQIADIEPLDAGRFLVTVAGEDNRGDATR